MKPLTASSPSSGARSMEDDGPPKAAGRAPKKISSEEQDKSVQRFYLYGPISVPSEKSPAIEDCGNQYRAVVELCQPIPKSRIAQLFQGVQDGTYTVQSIQAFIVNFFFAARFISDARKYASFHAWIKSIQRDSDDLARKIIEAGLGAMVPYITGKWLSLVELVLVETIHKKSALDTFLQINKDTPFPLICDLKCTPAQYSRALNRGDAEIASLVAARDAPSKPASDSAKKAKRSAEPRKDRKSSPATGSGGKRYAAGDDDDEARPSSKSTTECRNNWTRVLNNFLFNGPAAAKIEWDKCGQENVRGFADDSELVRDLRLVLYSDYKPASSGDDDNETYDRTIFYATKYYYLSKHGNIARMLGMMVKLGGEHSDLGHAALYVLSRVLSIGKFSLLTYAPDTTEKTYERELRLCSVDVSSV